MKTTARPHASLPPRIGRQQEEHGTEGIPRLAAAASSKGTTRDQLHDRFATIEHVIRRFCDFCRVTCTPRLHVGQDSVSMWRLIAEPNYKVNIPCPTANATQAEKKMQSHRISENMQTQASVLKIQSTQKNICFAKIICLILGRNYTDIPCFMEHFLTHD